MNAQLATQWLGYKTPASPQGGEYIVSYDGDGGWVSHNPLSDYGEYISRQFTGFIPGNTYNITFYTVNAGAKNWKYRDDGFWKLAIGPVNADFFGKSGLLAKSVSHSSDLGSVFLTDPQSYERHGKQTWVQQKFTFVASHETLKIAFASSDVAKNIKRAVMGLDSISISTDSDGDGLSDALEVMIGTNPHVMDTDDDGLLDGEEIDVYHTDPTMFDTDGDGASDGLEVQKGTDANDNSDFPAPANHAPVAVDDAGTVEVGGAVTVSLSTNDTDSDGTIDPDTIVITNDPSNGEVVVNSDGTITYTPTTTHPGTDVFHYTIQDADGAPSNAATVTITITDPAVLPTGCGINSASPVSHYVAGALVTMQGGVVTLWGDASGQGNDLSSTGDPMVINNGLNGHAVMYFDGDDDRLQRLSGLNGLPGGAADRTMYAVVNYESNGIGGVMYGNDSNNQAFGLAVNRTGDLSIQGWGIANDYPSDVVGTNTGWMIHSVVLSSDVVTHYRNGAQIDTFGQIYNTNTQKLVIGAEIDGLPAVDMQIAEVLVYDSALSASQQAELNACLDDKYFAGILGNHAPVAVDDAGTVEIGGSVAVSLSTNDTDSDGTIDPEAIVITNGPADGDVVVNGDGTITYTPTTTHPGTDTFYYTIQDDDGAKSNAATVTITITEAANHPPVAVDDAGTVEVGGAVTVSLSTNDTDSDGTIDPDTIVITNDPSNGEVVVNSDGTITYTPTITHPGTDTFHYTIQDDVGAPSNAATVTITITEAARDSDKDGLSDDFEKRIGTNPYREDTDRDGLKDGEEVNVYMTNPLKRDTDSDGLKDGVEVKFGSDPLLKDTDGDGMSDKWELRKRTDPNNPDTDGDGLNGYDEWKKYYTNPTKTDTDRGGVNDGDEVARGSNPRKWWDDKRWKS